MNATTLFQRIASLWPESLEISDARRNAGGEIWFPTLAKINANVEDGIDFTSDHWANIGAWAFYQSITEVSRARAEKAESMIQIDLIPIELFDKFVRMNLESEGFDQERTQYLGI
jgi:hypothetical protein